ncbi:MAG: hypothetical protein JO254_15725, partial [Pseudolabrys sp.]|nr:hypothetical protein [Pseudolabrys sp.]
PVKMAPGTYGSGGRYNGPGFFDFLFGGGQQAYAPQSRTQRGRVSTR